MKLHFKGDVTDSLLEDLNQLYGLHMTYNEFYEVTTAEYDPTADLTTAYYKVIPHKKGIARLEAEHDGQIGKLNKLYRAGITS